MAGAKTAASKRLGQIVPSRSFVKSYEKFFNLEFDETTISDNNALLKGYVRYVFDQKIIEKLLYYKCFEIDTKDKKHFKLCQPLCRTNLSLLRI